jgi:hypothetical protein
MEGRCRPHEPDYVSNSNLLRGKRDLHHVAGYDLVDFVHELVAILRLHEPGVFLDKGFCDFDLVDGFRPGVARLTASCLPNCLGRSRQRLPERAIHSRAFRNRRLLVRGPRLPLSPPGTNASSRSHWSSRSASQSTADLQKSALNLICAPLGILVP